MSNGVSAEVIEKVLIQGDLKALTAAERVTYYNGVCKSLGLNPLTRPFDYLNLNGKTLLYAKRECTEQLRQIHGVNLSIKAREVIEGCYVVTATAVLPGGRQDESIGAVPIEGLKGESRSNAMMKAETKAKRRVTLSICGLAFLDESEVDSVEVRREPNELASPEKPWRTFKEMLDVFAEAKKQLGPDRENVYYGTLQMSGVKHANEFRDSAKALATYHALQEAIENFPQAAEEDPATK
jgi:hypothetical protein